MTPESRSRRRAAKSDAGSATLEIAIVGPVLLLLIFTIVQGSLWFYARNLALAAAQEGVSAGRGYGASASIGVTKARSFLDRAAQDSLQSIDVSSSGSTPTQIRIQVRGRSLSVLPGVPGITVSQSAQAPVERFTVGAP